MKPGLTIFEKIQADLIASEPEVSEGKMMSAPGLKYRKDTFLFYLPKTDEMGFRLGAEFSPGAYGLETAHLLSPFKTKPPLKAWHLVHSSESAAWEELAKKALQFTRDL